MKTHDRFLHVEEYEHIDKARDDNPYYDMNSKVGLDDILIQRTPPSRRHSREISNMKTPITGKSIRVRKQDTGVTPVARGTSVGSRQSPSVASAFEGSTTII